MAYLQVKSLALAVVDTRSPTASQALQPIEFPFNAGGDPGGRAWRPITPGIGFTY